jgi:hypothetical protein
MSALFIYCTTTDIGTGSPVSENEIARKLFIRPCKAPVHCAQNYPYIYRISENEWWHKLSFREDLFSVAREYPRRQSPRIGASFLYLEAVKRVESILRTTSSCLIDNESYPAPQVTIA